MAKYTHGIIKTDRRLDSQPMAKVFNKNKETGVNIICQYSAKYKDTFNGTNSAIFTENNG